MQGNGQRAAADSAEAPPGFRLGVENGHVETILQWRERGPVDAVEEPAVCGAAAQIHMLSVVHGELAALEGEGEPAEPWSAFEQGDPHPGVRQCERGRDSGQPAADHYGAGPFRAARGLRGLRLLAHRAPSPAAVPR
jgi:hypothetical protein